MHRPVVKVVLAAALLIGCEGSTDVPGATETDAVATAPAPTNVPATRVPTPQPTTPPPAETSTTERNDTVPTPEPTETQTAPEPTAAAEPDCARLSGFASDGENALWRVVNDGVMGGRSSGGPTFLDSTMRFAGEINTNGGGFSSVRVDLLPGSLDGYNNVVVRARTDGRTYKIIFDDTLDGRDRRISHQADLVFGEADAEGWQRAIAPFNQLRASLFGRSVDVAPFRNDLAIEMGVMISDGIDGPFQIDINQIDVCR